MKKIVVAVMAGFCYLMMANFSTAEIIWLSSFETGDFSEWTSVSGNWTTSGGDCHAGSKRAQVNGTDGTESILTLMESTEGYEDVTLSYWHRIYAGLEEGDFLYAEYTSNGVDWENLKTYTEVVSTTEWQEETILLPKDAADNPAFGLRFRAEMGASSDCVYFDDVSLCSTVPEPSFLFLFLPLMFCVFRRQKMR